MKNIIFLTQLQLWSMDDRKGAPSFYKTIEAYINDNWNVTLIYPNYKPDNENVINRINNVTFKPIFHNLTKLKKIGFIGRIAHSLYGNYMLYRLAKKILLELNYSAIIYSYEVHGVNAGKRLQKKYGIPLITRFQGTILANIENTFINRIKKYPHFQALSTKADIVIMTNDGTKGLDVLKRLNNNTENIMFWKNGVDIKLSTALSESELLDKKRLMGISSDDEILITVSRLASWKRVDRAINALAEVIKQKPNCKLIIVGDGDEKNNLMMLAKKLGLADNIIFKGAVLQTEVRDYLETADIFLSLYDLSNLGNPLMEAMSCGKAIITLDVGDTNTVIENNVNGILLKLEEIDKIPYYIIKMLDDKNYSKQLGNKAKEFAEMEFWSWQDRMREETEMINNFKKDYNFLNKRSY